MADIFNNAPQFGGRAFRGSNFTLQITTPGGAEALGVDALVQSCNLQYAQQIQMIRELGSQRFYYVIGLPQGAGSMNRIVTDKKSAQKIQDASKDVCKPSSVRWNYSQADGGDSCPDAEFSLTAESVLFNQVAYTLSVANFQLGETASFMFGALNVN